MSFSDGSVEAQHHVACGDDHAGRTVAALQAVLAAEGFAQCGGDLVGVEALDRRHLGLVACHRIGDAGADGRTVDEYGAGAADAVLAAQMSAGEVVRLAQEVGQVRAGLDVGAEPAPVDGEGDGAHRAAASSTARRSATT